MVSPLRLAAVGCCFTVLMAFMAISNTMSPSHVGAQTLPECFDSIDNDSDGLTDWGPPGAVGVDPCCTTPTDTSESCVMSSSSSSSTSSSSSSSSPSSSSSSSSSSAATSSSSSSTSSACTPPTSILPQCMDSIDNDCDGLTDWPADTDCSGLADPLEGSVSSSSSSSSTTSSSSSSSPSSSSTSSSTGGGSTGGGGTTGGGSTGGSISGITDGGEGTNGNGAYRNHRSTMFLSALQTVLARAGEIINGTPEGAFGGGQSSSVYNRPLTQSELQPFCSAQRMVGPSTTSDILQLIASTFSMVFKRDQEFFVGLLKNPDVCANITATLRPDNAPVMTALRPVQLGEDGYPVSSNVVWNKCVRGTATLADIRSNTDRMRVTRNITVPKTCGSYRTAGTNEWSYPDDAFLTLSIIAPAPASGELPTVSASKGYVVVPSPTAVAAEESTSNAQ